jgi:hypothetical protein
MQYVVKTIIAEPYTQVYVVAVTSLLSGSS